MVPTLSKIERLYSVVLQALRKDKTNKKRAEKLKDHTKKGGSHNELTWAL